MLYVESTRERWDEAMNLAWSLDRQGIILPLQDIHIAVCGRLGGVGDTLLFSR